MYEVRKSTEAEADLIDIWVYSLCEWDAERADKYVDDLEAAMRLLERNPNLGRSREDLGPGYRSLTIHRHIAFYTVDESVVRIIRVLHGRIEPNRRL